MSEYKALARAIRKGYNELKNNSIYKLYTVTPEIIVENDAGFKAVIIGNIKSTPQSRGYMYLFYANDTDDTEIPFPTAKEIERRLKIVANKGILDDADADYFDWEEYGTLEKQREYFSEIVTKEAKNINKMLYLETPEEKPCTHEVVDIQEFYRELKKYPIEYNMVNKTWIHEIFEKLKKKVQY